VLEDLGYEPRAEGTGVELVNCPFHALAEDHPDLVCAMNLDLMTGMLAGLDHAGLDATLDPGQGRCCVRFREVPRRRAQSARPEA